MELESWLIYLLQGWLPSRWCLECFELSGHSHNPLDELSASATLGSCSMQGMQQQTTLAIRSVIATMEMLLMKQKQ